MTGKMIQKWLDSRADFTDFQMKTNDPNIVIEFEFLIEMSAAITSSLKTEHLTVLMFVFLRQAQFIRFVREMANLWTLS